MTAPPRGFALAAVLAALVLMMMVLAISAQRALLAARQGTLVVERVELAAAVAAARAATESAPVDTQALRSAPPGFVLASGESTAGAAHASWALKAGAAELAVAEITAVVGSGRTAARARARGILAAKVDSAGALKWGPTGGVGWVKLPVP